MKRIIVLALVLILAVGLFSGCAQEIIEPDAEKIAKLTQYESESGIKVGMAKGFTETEIEGVDSAWLNESVALSCNIDTFEYLEEQGFTVKDEKDYAKQSIKRYGHNVKPMVNEYGVTFVTYNQVIRNTSYSYAAFYNMGEKSYLCATFTCPTEDFEEYKESFHLWSTTLEF